ncbi:MAG: hypothetical protein EVB11_09425 [Winogradskyella sp.]|nr:MAG: hypothetical protein EVB11_09425 [Winogradskyella sp.]
MKFFKQFFGYLTWILLSLLIGVIYMRVLVGSIEEPSTAITFLLNIFYSYGILYVGGLIGLVIAFVFILIDIFYLKNKLKNVGKSLYIRFAILLGIASVVFVIHYILEKVIDII